VPFTPFHFGPGGLVATATRSSVSFLSFCASNVLIDVESLYNMVTHQPRVHTFLHTYVGSTLAAGVVVLAFLPARRIASKLPEWSILSWQRLPVRAVAAGALLGAWSHVLLDSIMHGDITPWAPFSNTNGLYHVIPIGLLHNGCVAAGIVALIWWMLPSNKPLQRSGTNKVLGRGRGDESA
jgi:membrane-bound metal-dependent hydrolase YbcI (DUF457 family)